MIRRLNKDGEYISVPRDYTDSDCEICGTNYPHPSATSGMHTNGPFAIWIRKIGGEWINTQERSMHKVRMAWVDMGIEWFELLAKEQSQ